MADVVDRGGDSSRRPTSPNWSKMTAKCGHEDPLGYFAGTVCNKCAKEGYRKATKR
jgi:hypothetical protein